MVKKSGFLFLLFLGISSSSFAFSTAGDCSLSLSTIGGSSPVRSSVNQYLRQISKYPLLSVEETIRLFEEVSLLRQKIFEKLFSSKAGLEFLSEAIKEQGDSKKRAAHHFRADPRSVCEAPSLLPENATETQIESHKKDWIHFIEELQNKIEKALSSGNISSLKIHLSELSFSQLFFRNRILPGVLDSLNQHKKLKTSRLGFDEKDFELVEKLVRVRSILASANLRLAVAMAKGFGRRGIELGDLIDMANLELIQAIDSYDLRLDVRFSTYAAGSIKKGLLRQVWEEKGLIQVPEYIRPKVAAYNRAVVAFFQSEGRMPSDKEVMSVLGIKGRDLQRINRVIQAFRVGQQTKKSGSNSESDEIIDVLHFIEVPSVAENSADLELLRLLISSGNYFIDREIKILDLYFGLSSRKPMTLEEVGRKVGVSRERVRQIKEEVLKKLQSLMETES